MTIIVSLKNATGAIIASDSRISTALGGIITSYRDSQQKIFKISDRGAIGIHGTTDIAINCMRKYLEHRKGDIPENVNDIADTFNSFLEATIKSSYQEEIKPGYIGFILAGLDRDNVPHIYSLESSDLFIVKESHQILIGGVYQYASFLGNLYYADTLSISNLVDLAVYLVDETARAINTIGGPIQLITFDGVNGFKQFSPDEIRGIIVKNRQMINTIKRHFGHSI